MDKRRRRRRRNRSFLIDKMIMCGLVIFVIVGSVYCRVAESHAEKAREEAAVEAARKEKERAEKKAAEEEQLKKDARAKSFTVQPGVAVGTCEPSEEKVVYLTFDDGPSERTPEVLEILKRYDAKATFFVTGAQPGYRPYIKQAYDEGHTIGMHTFSHDYATVYASVEAYFNDLEAIAQVVKEQLGFVPCFIRFPGGSSNTISVNYCAGIMSQLAPKVEEMGYQYYDWNCSNGDGNVVSTEQAIANATGSTDNNIMILCHDSPTKHTTVEALPVIIEHYQSLGYAFKAIDRESYVVHHEINN